jgi:hypothetical protein
MRRSLLVLFSVLAMASCHRASDPGAPSPAATPTGPQHRVDVPVNNQEAALRQRLDAVKSLTGDQLVAAHALPFQGKLGYDPATAQGMDRIKKSSLAPTAAEEAKLASQGFVISDTKKVPSFTYGYAQVYGAHLPLYISADSILHAIHRSYDDALAWIEDEALHGDVAALLGEQRERLKGSPPAGLSADARKDLDVFLGVGLALLRGQPVAPVAGGDDRAMQQLVDQAMRAQGTARVSLFGVERDVDFSQFKPRGHYADRPERQRYFRAMIWFGRTELRLVESTPQGGQVLNRRQLEAALALADLTTGPARERHDRIDRAIGLFIGENDSMNIAGAAALRADLAAPDLPSLARIDDATLLARILASSHGTQRIASQLMVNDSDKPLPLHRSFQLFGQRYTVDSHVLSNVTYDRTKAQRLMPSPLDAAYAALGNDQAAALLAPEMKRHAYAPDLESVRLLVDAHEPAYWDGSLYTLWISSLRSLSPSASELKDPKAAGLPAVATTEAWGRRLLNTQLASWAELRHDTLLYAKQSYTASIACEFPDAYVDPYPEFYKQLGRYARRGKEISAQLKASYPQARLIAEIEGHYTHLTDVLGKLQGMAEQQRRGKPFSAEQMAFVNETVKLESVGCGSQTATGWYPRLFLSEARSLDFDPTIADIHTQPTDEQGAPVGRVLHVATGYPRWMLVTADTCQGPRAYVGFASSYFEKVTSQFERLDDAQWSQEINQKHPADVPWMSSLIAR